MTEPVNMKPLIYAVDDIEQARELYVATLSESYNVRVFENYEECLRVIKVEKPHVILCDLILPSMNGWEGINAIKKAAPGTHLIVATCLNNPIQHETAEIKGLKFWPKSSTKHLKRLIKECLT